jgi:Zinc-binding loop region of homing endonuclease
MLVAYNASKPKVPAFLLSTDDMIELLFKHTPGGFAENPLEHVGDHLIFRAKLTTSKLHNGLCYCRKDRNIRVHAKTLVFLLFRDGMDYVNSPCLQISQICGSVRCVAPDHLVLEDASTSKQRKKCQMYPGIPCEHEPECLRDDLAFVDPDEEVAAEPVHGRGRGRAKAVASEGESDDASGFFDEEAVEHAPPIRGLPKNIGSMAKSIRPMPSNSSTASSIASTSGGKKDVVVREVDNILQSCQNILHTQLDVEHHAESPKRKHKRKH